LIPIYLTNLPEDETMYNPGDFHGG
jgi:hypothetical protein